jgi:enoyl-CoA hydratase
MRSCENLEVRREGGVLVVQIHRPATLNALSRATLEELRGVVTDAAADASIGAIVLTGGETGKKPSFAAGADIGELAQLGMLAARGHARLGQQVLDAIERSPVPVIAAVNGFALGGGLELAMACHVRWASSDAKLGQPEINLGIIPGFAGTQRLPRLVGAGRALEMLLSGDPIGADEALRIGLVNRVLEPAALMPAVMELAKKIASKAPIARSLILDAVRRGAALPFDAAQELEADLFGIAGGTEDTRAGLKAFLEKRPAEWKGR